MNTLQKALCKYSRRLSGLSGLIPYDDSTKAEFTEDAWETFVAHTSDLGDEVYLEASKTAADRPERPVQISAKDATVAFHRIIFRRAIRRKTPRLWLKLSIAVGGILCGFYVNQASAQPPVDGSIVRASILVVITLALVAWDYLLETQP
jgi:hypothetical protein